MSSLSDFDIVVEKLPFSATKANILFNLSKFNSEEELEKYKNFIVDTYYKGQGEESFLFYPPLYPELKDIHRRISYIKHDRVGRQGVQCKFCKGVNTQSREERRGGGDEYIPSRVECFDCGKKYLN